MSRNYEKNPSISYQEVLDLVYIELGEAGLKLVTDHIDQLRRERDEAVEVIRELREMADRHVCGECGGFLDSELDFAPLADRFLARIEQSNKEKQD